MSINIEQKFPYNFTVIDRIYENIDTISGSMPFFIYQRLGTTLSPKLYFSYKINYGFYYLLRRVNVCYDSLVVNNSGLGVPIAYLRNLAIEFIENVSHKSKQNLPIPLNLLSSPGNYNIDVQPTSTILEFRARSLKYSHVLNYMYQHGNNIDLSINTMDNTAGFVIDLMLEGYLIPEKSLEQWS